MSRIGLTRETLAAAEEKRDGVMLDLVLADDARLEENEREAFEDMRDRRRPLSPKQRSWVESVVARLGHTRDVGPVEDYAERTKTRTSKAESAPMPEWMLGPKVLTPPGRRS